MWYDVIVKKRQSESAFPCGAPQLFPLCQIKKSKALSKALGAFLLQGVSYVARSVSFPFYRSKAWQQCREAYLRSVCGLCEECAKQGIVKSADIVHHKITLDDEKARDPDIALNFKNLQAVCIDCHNRIHFGSIAEKRYKIVDGELIIPDEVPHR